MASSSSIQFGALGSVPTFDQKKYPDVYYDALLVRQAISILSRFVDLYTASTIIAVLSEDIPAGAVVNFYSVAGTITARKASALDGTKPGMGFSESNQTNGSVGSFRASGFCESMSGLVPGNYYYLSDSSPGNVTATAPTTAGHLVQGIGLALTSTTMVFRPAAPWKQL